MYSKKTMTKKDDTHKDSKKAGEKLEAQQEVVDDKKLAQVQEKALDFENKYKRALADYQNLEKRVSQERVQWIKTASKDVLLRLLPVVDTLILASKHSTDQTLAVSLQQFLQVLLQEGVERIKTAGEMFDPNTMECIATAQGEEGKVLEELRPGYKIYDAVLRPAQVTVGKKSS